MLVKEGKEILESLAGLSQERGGGAAGLKARERLGILGRMLEKKFQESIRT